MFIDAVIKLGGGGAQDDHHPPPPMSLFIIYLNVNVVNEVVVDRVGLVSCHISFWVSHDWRLEGTKKGPGGKRLYMRTSKIPLKYDNENPVPKLLSINTAYLRTCDTAHLW